MNLYGYEQNQYTHSKIMNEMYMVGQRIEARAFNIRDTAKCLRSKKMVVLETNLCSKFIFLQIFIDF